MRKHVDIQIDELLRAGVITPDDGSPFASPIIMVEKPNGEFRFCVDMRNLNKICLPLFYELPIFEDILELMTRNKAQIITKLNMKQAYHQIPLTEDSSYKTTFITPHRGAFRYLRLPQGCSQSSYHMQVALTKLFRNQIGTYLLVYLNDVIAVSESPSKHLEHLKVIFEKFRQTNLKLHPKKCKFFRSQVKYLRFILSAEGVQSDPKQTAIVRNYPTPKKLKI